MDSIGSEERILKGQGQAPPVAWLRGGPVKFSSIYPDSTVLGAREKWDGRDWRNVKREA